MMVKTILKKKLLVVGLLLMTMTLIMAVFAPLIAPNDPLQLNPADKFATPSSLFPLGTDQLGRCVFSRLVYGARYSLVIAIPTLTILAVIGVGLGSLMAFKGGIIDRILVVFCDIFGAFPSMIIIIALVGILGNSVTNIIIAAIISSGAYYIRIGRGYSKAEAGKDYIIGAKIAGCSDFQIVTKHIIPNILPTFAIFVSSGVSSVILMVAGFSYLGVGLETGIPEWGAMLTEAKSFLYTAPHLIIYPGLFIFLAAAGFTFFAEGLRDLLSAEDTSV